MSNFLEDVAYGIYCLCVGMLFTLAAMAVVAFGGFIGFAAWWALQ